MVSWRYCLALCSSLAAAEALKPLCRELPSSSLWRDCRVQIGGLAIQGPTAFERALNPTFQAYLTEVLNATLGLEFEALPLTQGEDAARVRQGTLDYVYTNPSAFTCLLVEFKVVAVASLMNFRRGNALDRFAGVIFSRVDSNFSTVEDLRRAKVAAVAISGLGAMQLQQAQLLETGINIMTDARQIVFTGNQNKIVEEVQNGWADVGFVRTDMIDRVEARGDTNWDYFQVINEIQDEGFPFRRSTAFTPEWPLGAMPHVPSEVSQEVALALMRLDRFSTDPALSEPAIAGSFVKFVLPMNYVDLLGMLESVGYYSSSEGRCVQAADVLGFVQCPSGWVKQRPEVAFCPPEECRSEYTCLCRPCVKLKDPELVLTVEALPTSWNPNVNGTAVAAQTSLAQSCSRMSRCAKVARGQRISWRLLDQIGEAVRTEINQYRLETVEMLTELQGSWRPLAREPVVIDDLQTERYVLDMELTTVGETIVQLRINGKQAAISPVVVEVFEPIPQRVLCPAGHRVQPNGRCSPCPPGTKASEITDVETGIPMASCVPCSSGSFQRLAGQAKCDRCGVGFVTAEEGSASCSQCPPGSSTLGEEGASVCTPCPPGQVTNATDSSSRICQDCPVGRFAGQQGSTECQPCAPGSLSSTSGASRCVPCQAGSVAPLGGSAKCEPCPRGSYTEAASDFTQCTSCSLGLTTLELGSDNAGLCRCPAGFFFVPEKGCQHCGAKEWEGLECPGGNEPPLQVAGYWVQVVDAAARSYSVYRCRDAFECPAGHLGNCAAGRQGLACNDCQDGYKRSDLGECSRCADSSILPMLGAAGGSLLALTALVLVVDVDRNKRSLNHLTVLMVAGQVVMAMQALTAVKQLPILFTEPVKSILELMDPLSFDMDLLQVSCVFQSDNPLVKFSLQLLVYPFCAAMVMVIAGGCRLFKKYITFDAIFNLNGILLFMLFITITLTVLTPFQCAPSPNGTTHMSINPGVVCWSSDKHVVLIVLALLGTLAYPVSILSWTIWTTLMYPRRMHSGEGLRYIHRHRFLFERFHIHCYYYGLLLMLRNAAVALVPVVFVAVPFAQLVSTSVVFLLGFTVQSRLWPWRTELANRADLGASVFLILVITSCAPLVSADSDSDGLLFSICLCITVLGALLTGLSAIAFGLYRRLVPVCTYQVFLCHHKAGAGSLCRYLKLLLSRLAEGKVFLDSDNLEDLDTLFEIVRSNCKSLVVVMTSEVLKRVWCAGEMVTAHRNKVNIVPLRCEDFGLGVEIDLTQVSSYWTREQKHMLASCGITPERVVAAYRHVLELPFLQFSRAAPPNEQETVLLKLTSVCGLTRRKFAGTTSHTGRPRIVILGAVSDLEALATCQIVECLVRRRVQVETMILRDTMEAETALGGFTHVIVVLTRGLLTDPAFVEIFGFLRQTSGRASSPDNKRSHTPASATASEFVIVNADPGFQFPDTEYYKGLAKGNTPSGIPSEHGPRLAEAYRTLFTVLACPLTPHGSEGLLMQQMDEVCGRIKDVNSSQNSTPSAPVKKRSDMDFTPRDTATSLFSQPPLGAIEETQQDTVRQGPLARSCSTQSATLVSQFRTDVASRRAGQVVSNILV